MTTAAMDVVLPDSVDLHARPAAQLVRAAMGFQSKILVGVPGREADAKSLLTVLALGARRGTNITLSAEGEDASEAVATLADLVRALTE